jgi:hypothetical protein
LADNEARPSDLHLTAREFLSERRDFLYVYAAPSESGTGWDVVVRIDGTYSEHADAEDAGGGIRQMFDMLVDVPRDRRTWWEGPPKGPENDSVRRRPESC